MPTKKDFEAVAAAVRAERPESTRKHWERIRFSGTGLHPSTGLVRIWTVRAYGVGFRTVSGR